jgi:threonine dehydrogenase-like Zn-dependent dehydrogenase
MAKTMKAAVVHEFGKPLLIEEVPVPTPGQGEVLIKVMANGVCHTDLHAAQGDWPARPRAVSGLAESGFPREAEGRSLQHRFGFVRVPWPDPIRRICANAW